MISNVYKGRSMSEAKEAAEAELGDDAVILTTRRVPRDGISGLLGGMDVEICAAAANALAPVVAPPMAPVSAAREGPFSSAAYRAERVPPQNEFVALRAEVRNEMRTIRGLMSKSGKQPPALEGELSALREAVDRIANPEPRSGRLAKLLRQSGIEGPAAAQVARIIRERKVDDGGLADAYRDALTEIIFPVAWPLANRQRTVCVMIGPSGVGKTTTAAKLAARAALDHDNRVALISADAYRVGATEQLSRYAELMRADFQVAGDRRRLTEALQTSDADFIVVDTAGQVGDGEDSLEKHLTDTLRQGAHGMAVHILLCLPASIRAVDADRFARLFAPYLPTSIVVTKIDETRAPGGLVHGTMASRLPVSALCFGPRVPEDISPSTRGGILDHLIFRQGAGQKAA